jgi:hypothetical protein
MPSCIALFVFRQYATLIAPEYQEFFPAYPFGVILRQVAEYKFGRGTPERAMV